MNPAFEATLGYSRQELLSRPFLDFIHPDDRIPTKRCNDAPGDVERRSWNTDASAATAPRYGSSGTSWQITRVGSMGLDET
jgi:PAS domain S-box-containing protein